MYYGHFPFFTLLDVIEARSDAYINMFITWRATN